MTDKISCPTLNVVLIKAIRALCEVTIKFDHTLEITGSLHVRSDGDKVLTCLLNEDCIKSSSSHLNDVALKLGLVNAALALSNISIIQSSLINKANEVVANAMTQQTTSSRNLCNFSGDGVHARSLMSSAVDSLPNSSSNIFSFGGGHVALPLPDTNNNLKPGKAVKTGGSRCRKKVETVARTLASIKTASHGVADRSVDFNPMEVNITTVKLPDIQTLAHRLPSYEAVTGDIEGTQNFQGAKVKVHSPSSSGLMMVPIKHSPESIKKEVAEDGAGSKPSAQKGQQRVKKFQCMFCGIFLSTKCYLKNHINAMHTRLHVYKCDLCEHSFYSAGAMRIHKLRNHWHDSKKHRCSECNESFLLPIELRKHMQKRHHNLQTTSGPATSTPAVAVFSKHQQPASTVFVPSVGSGGKRATVYSTANPPGDSKPPDNVDQMKVEPGESLQSTGSKKLLSSSSPGFSVHNGVTNKSI